eukprot:6172677-Pleurochrysis_carterae.AAC.1
MSLQDSSDRTSDQARRGTPLRWKVGDDVKTALLSVYQHTPYPSASMRRSVQMPSSAQSARHSPIKPLLTVPEATITSPRKG